VITSRQETSRGVTRHPGLQLACDPQGAPHGPSTAAPADQHPVPAGRGRLRERQLGAVKHLRLARHPAPTRRQGTPPGSMPAAPASLGPGSPWLDLRALLGRVLREEAHRWCPWLASLRQIGRSFADRLLALGVRGPLPGQPLSRCRRRPGRPAGRLLWSYWVLSCCRTRPPATACRRSAGRPVRVAVARYRRCPGPPAGCGPGAAARTGRRRAGLGRLPVPR
jgi:hypothetical protein